MVKEVRDDLRDAAKIVISQCMAVKPGEGVLILTDEPEREIGYVLWEEAKAAGAEAVITEIITRRVNGEEPPPAVAEFMKNFSVILIPTSRSLSHTEARRQASKAGARIATLPGITAECMVRTLVADYSAIAERSTRMAGILSRGKIARLTSPAGCDVTFCIEGREASPDTGIYHLPGDFGNLPAGEAYIAPQEGTASGIIVVDGAMAGVGMVDEPIVMRVEDGYVRSIEGGEGARRLLAILEGLPGEARNVAELGVGTNDRAVITGNVLGDEKALGTVHVAIGDNSGFGGKVKVPSHLDGIILRPTLVIDGVEIIKNGVHA
ncbi:MAG TPA: aminopeptidase [Firmicutes bacterium]|nr:aminopeptidase [Bacillota bacterium]